MQKVWENEAGYDEHPEIEPILDAGSEEYYKCIPEKYDGSFVYPDAIRRGEIFAEDIEEAVIQYLVKGGLDEETLRTSPMHFQHPDTGRGVTTKVLTVTF